MIDPDEALDKIEEIYRQFGQFCRQRGAASEADTRHKIIDRVLHEVLNWPHEQVSLEKRADNGIIDYVLHTAARPLVVVEAKKSGTTWHIPLGRLSKRIYELSGVIKKEKDLNSAIEQAQGYCNNQGIKYSIVTNGYSYIIFNAINYRHPWRQGKAIVYSGPKDITGNFLEFYQLLEYNQVLNGSLDNALIKDISLDRIYDKPLDHVTSADALYGRNMISTLLHPYIDTFFGDISAQTNEEILEECYVYSGFLRRIDKDLIMALRDEIPDYALRDGFTELQPTAYGDELRNRIEQYSSQVKESGFIILMGGIGCGKSTYLRRFIKLMRADEAQNKMHFIYIDHLGYASKLESVKDFIYKNIFDHLKGQPNIISRTTLELIYSDDIKALRETKFKKFKDPVKFDEKIGDFLYDKLNDNFEFSEKTLKTLNRAKILPVIIFDNVDQLPLDIQIDIFEHAQYFSRKIGCLSILALREESYFTSRMQKIFTAYALQKYHISSPSFRKLIELRINKALEEIPTKQKTDVRISGRNVTTDDVRNYLQVIHQNLFRRYKPVISLIQSLCYGNMRFALEIMNSFLTSGTTDVAKILKIYMATGYYTVAFHEFVKSVMLGEFRYYKESRSPIVNLYDVQACINSSHFTGIRVLRYLSKYNNVPSPEGVGFVLIDDVFTLFEEIFSNQKDIKLTILKFINLNKHLLELNTRSTDSLNGAAYVRITPAGSFYIKDLFKIFVYLDLVWHDTPINNSSFSRDLVLQINKVDIEYRFKRVQQFIKYLELEETREIDLYSLSLINSPIAEKITPTLFSSLKSQKAYILNKMHQ